MNESPELYSSMPVATPHILTDRDGYDSDGEKIVVFKANEIPDDFEVINAQTGETVYADKVKTKKNLEESQELLGYGYFTDVTEEGYYYVSCNGLGKSYTFAITDDTARKIFPDSLEAFEKIRDDKISVKYVNDKSETTDLIVQGGWLTNDNGDQDVLSSAETMMTLLAAYELFPDSFNEFTTDAGEIRVLDALYHESVWMLSMQDEKTGGIYAGLTSDAGKNYKLNDITYEASASFAAVMAKFSYVYKSVDSEYASLCLKAADLAWKYLSKQKAIASSAEYAPILASAASELYRASGLQSYYTYANDLLPSNPDFESSHWYLFASETYMLTRKSVSVNKCASVMKKLMKQAEIISSKSRDDDYLISEMEGDDSFETLLWNMVILSTADYVLTNNEYANVINNHEHYFRGRNVNSEDLIYQNGEYKLKDLRSNAMYVYMLSQILSSDYYVAPSDSDY